MEFDNLPLSAPRHCEQPGEAEGQCRQRVAGDQAAAQQGCSAHVRGQRLPLQVAAMPFVTNTYKR